MTVFFPRALLFASPPFSRLSLEDERTRKKGEASLNFLFEMPPKRHQQQQQQQRPTPKAASTPPTTPIASLPHPGPLRMEMVLAWFAGALASVQIVQHVPRGTALAVILARRLQVSGAPLELLGATAPDVATLTAKILLHRATHWHENESLADARLGDHPLTHVLEAAAELATADNFTFAPSVARTQSPPTVGSDPRVEVVSPSPVPVRPQTVEEPVRPQVRTRTVDIQDPPVPDEQKKTTIPSRTQSARLPRQPSVVVVEVGARSSEQSALARDELRAIEDAPIWSSHVLSTRHGQEPFDAAERTVLFLLPEIALVRKPAEPDFEELKITLRAVVGHAAAIMELPPNGIETYLADILGRRGGPVADRAVRPHVLRNIRHMAALFVSSAPAPQRALALFDLAAEAARLDPRFDSQQARTRLDRLLTAAITTHPASAKQVTRWMAPKVPTGTPAPDCELPLATPSPLPVRHSAIF